MKEKSKSYGPAPACSFAFVASTGRTATMFIAKTLNTLSDVTALHEGHLVGEKPAPQLPLINFHNRRAWDDADYAAASIATLRSQDAMLQAAGNASLLVDVAFNNAPFFQPLSETYPDAKFIAIFRRCEGFVRSATITTGEDTQPAGWPDRNKPLTDREKFISLGRLKPTADSEYHAAWEDWSAIQRNIWLWSRINSTLAEFVSKGKARYKLFYEDLAKEPESFWVQLLNALEAHSEANLLQCVEQSRSKTNQRAFYHIGPVSEWNSAEQSLYQQLAQPLENRIYVR